MILGIEFADRLNALDPPKDAYRILTWIQRSLRYRNMVNGWTCATIGEQCSTQLSRQRVSNMLCLLENAGIIQRRERERATLYIHPQYIFRGRPNEQAQAIAEWNAYALAHPLIAAVPASDLDAIAR
jgi:hypothetical protein